MSERIDETGNSYGMLTVTGPHEGAMTGACWLCRCRCGGSTIARGVDLRSGNRKSCGCLLSQNGRTHGMNGTATYSAWQCMKARCAQTKARGYKNYGGRGISICERWSHFENFLEDMSERPSVKHSIERIDNNGNYEPENCIWATATAQNRNKRNTRWLTLDGRTQSMAAWAEELGLHRASLKHRIDTGGWSIERALSTPNTRRL